MKKNKTIYPSVRNLQSLRRKAEDARRIEFPESDDFLERCDILEKKPVQGWQKSPVDPMDLLGVFKKLSLKQGYTLMAYVFIEGGNGNGIVWGLPETKTFPEPDECERLKDVFLSPPRPEGAVDFEDILTGTGTPSSYLEASLFIREAGEFGAQWHGCFWSDIRILSDSPFNSGGISEVISNEKDWKWEQDKPEDWRPKIIVGSDNITVCFYTYGFIGSEMIALEEDIYIKDAYKPDRRRHAIAIGPGGAIY